AVADPALTPEWQDLFYGGSNLTGLIPLPDGAYALIQALDLVDIPPDRSYPTWAVWKLRPGDQRRLGYVSLPGLRDLSPLYSHFHYGQAPLVEGKLIQTTVCDMTDTAGMMICRLLRLELEPPAIVELATVRIP